MIARNCLLCGVDGSTLRPHDRALVDHEAEQLAWSLVEWLQPVEGVRWTHLPRCVDRAGCRERVGANGEQWPVRDAGQAVQALRSARPEWVERAEPAVATDAPAAAESHAQLVEVFG